MKLRKIYESILNEIGDSAQVPPGAKFTDHIIKFDFGELTFIVNINKLVDYDNKLAISVDFTTEFKAFDLTGQNQPLKLMSYIIGGIFEWLDKFHRGKELIYIKYDPRSEQSEMKPGEYSPNQRDKLYRILIEKHAKKYGSSVNFSTTGGIIAQFKPPLEIK